MKRRMQTNKHEVFILVAETGKAGVTTTRLADLLGVNRTVLLQHLWRLAKAGSVKNLNPVGGGGEGVWVALGTPYAGVRDVSDVDQRWLKAGEYRVEVPQGPTSVWGLARAC